MWTDDEGVTATICQVLSALVSATLFGLALHGTSRCQGLERKLCDWMMPCSAVIILVFLAAMSQYYYNRRSIDDWYLALWPASLGVIVYSGYLTARLIAMSIHPVGAETSDDETD